MEIIRSKKLSELTVEEFMSLISPPNFSAIEKSRQKLLNVVEVAQLLGYKVSNIYSLTHKRLIPS